MTNPIKLFESRAILVKKEVTYNTDSTPVVATDAMLSFEGSVKVQADKLERKIDLPYFTANPFVLVGRRAMVEFDFDMIGAVGVGTAAPIAPVLRACGHAETLVAATSATYNPISNAFDSVTVYFFHAGIKFKITGARGTMKWDGSIKSYLKGHATLTGIIQIADITETAPGSVVLTPFQTPPAIETETLTITVGGVALNATKFSFDQNGAVNIFEGSESREVSITGRPNSGSLSIFQEALGTFNPWSIASALTDQAIVFTLDGGAGKKATLTMPKCQLEFPQQSNDNGAMTWDIPFVAKANAGGDEYAWKFE